MTTSTRIERDSLGEVPVPVNALYGAQIQRAIENFPISGLKSRQAFIWSLGMIKRVATQINMELGLHDTEKANAIIQAAQKENPAHEPLERRLAKVTFIECKEQII